MNKTIRTTIGVMLFILGIMVADSECLLVPIALLVAGAWLGKDMVMSDEQGRENR